MENRTNPQETQFLRLPRQTEEMDAEEVLDEVYAALREKGYNPVSQIVGYIMSGDPTYITSHNNARSTIMKAERDELVEEMLLAFIEANGWN